MLVYTFFAHILASLISRDFLFQLTQAEKGEAVANCDHLLNLTAPPKPGSRPIATNMSHVARFTDAFPVTAILSTLSRHLRWNHFVNLQQMHKDGITAWEDEKKAAQVFYVAATRATPRGVVGDWGSDCTMRHNIICPARVNSLEF